MSDTVETTCTETRDPRGSILDPPNITTPGLWGVPSAARAKWAQENANRAAITRPEQDDIPLPPNIIPTPGMHVVPSAATREKRARLKAKTTWPECVGMNGDEAVRLIRGERPDLNVQLTSYGDVIAAERDASFVRVFVRNADFTVKNGEYICNGGVVLRAPTVG